MGHFEFGVFADVLFELVRQFHVLECEQNTHVRNG